MNRRHFLHLLSSSSLAYAGIAGWSLSELSTSPPASDQAVRRFFRGVVLRGARGGIWGLIISEVILGVLHAFDIDIAGEVEKAVRKLLDRGESVTTHTVEELVRRELERREAAYGSSNARPFLSDVTRCGDGGRMRLREDGYELWSPAREDNPTFTPGPILWGALKHLDKPYEDVRCLSEYCGYPVSPWSRTHKRGTLIDEITQHFERGKVRLILDYSYERSLAGLYERNCNERTWIKL